MTAPSGGIAGAGTPDPSIGGATTGGIRVEQAGNAGAPSTYGGESPGGSCAGLSCSEVFTVPGGEFRMGCGEDDPDCLSREQPEHRAVVSMFRLDAFEVTVARFRPFVAAFPPPPLEGAGAHPEIPGTGWKPEWEEYWPQTREDLIANLDCLDTREPTWSAKEGVNDTLPIACVSWALAFAFCVWDGGRLPTEAEWEYAAAGGDEERLYPWGSDEPTIALAAFDCLLADDYRCSEDDRAVVGSFPAGRGRWGHFDLAGNLDEWVFDYYESTTYSDRAECDQCAMTEGRNRGRRGGSFTDDRTYLRATSRDLGGHEGAESDMTGFRCARE